MAVDIMFPMLFNLILAAKTTLLCFFLFFLIVFKSLFLELCYQYNEVRLALITETSASMTVANEAIETPSLFPDKAIKGLSK